MMVCFSAFIWRIEAAKATAGICVIPHCEKRVMRIKG